MFFGTFGEYHTCLYTSHILIIKYLNTTLCYSEKDGCREQRSRKAHSLNDIMNPKGVQTKGLWSQVFVKALPNNS